MKSTNWFRWFAVWQIVGVVNAFAQVNSWTNFASGKWEDAGSWSLGVAPSSNQSMVYLTNALTKTVSLDSSTVTNLSVLTVSNLFMAFGTIGRTNTLSIAMGSVTNRLKVLETLNVSRGGAVVLTNSALEVDNLSNASAGGLIVGGELQVKSGQLITTSADTMIDSTPGFGLIAIAAGLWQARNTAVGSFGLGTLTLAGGTNTLSGSLLVGFLASSTGHVWLTGGHLSTVNAASGIGVNGTGQMTVSNGIWTAAFVVLGNSSGANGTLTQAGGTVLIDFGTIGAATGGHGAVIISGGTLTAAHLFLGTSNCGGLGEVTVNAGQVQVTEGGNAILVIDNGTFTVNGGNVVLDRLVMNNACGRFIRNSGSLSITTLQLDPNMSAVGDGIPNGWKQQYGLDPFDPNLANQDPDGDGCSDLCEYLAGTDPTNSASAFGITSIVRTNNDLRVTWMQGIGKTNALERGAGTASGTFSNNFAAVFTVTNSVFITTNYLDLGAATNFPSRYYRIRLVL